MYFFILTVHSNMPHIKDSTATCGEWLSYWTARVSFRRARILFIFVFPGAKLVNNAQ